MSALRLIWLNLAILAAFGLQADVVFAQVFNGVQRRPVAGRSAYGPNYFTIMGHIGRPNTYELPTSQPNLVKFASLAGDLTKTAGGQIRIIRDGRVVQTIFHSEKDDFSLTPGDIAVVLGKVGQGRLIHRGNQSPMDAAGSDVSLAITGIRDYAIVLSIPSERATIRWITRQLGLDPGVADHVKVITQRQLNQVLPDTRLSTGTVLAYDPAMVDASRLPDNLPVPVKIGRPANPQTQPRPSIGPLTEQQLNQRQLPPARALVPNAQQGAAPGRALVPDISPSGQRPLGPTENLNLPPDEQSFVKQLLTDPDSVQLDEPRPTPSGQVFVSRPPVNTPHSSSAPSISPPLNSANVSPDRSPSGPASAAPQGAARITDAARRSENTASASGNIPGSNSAAGDASAAPVYSPEAQRPYQSTTAIPEPLQPFGSSRQGHAAAASLPVDLSSTPGGSSETRSPPVAENSLQSTTDESVNGFSLALQGAGVATTAIAGSQPTPVGDSRATLSSSPPPGLAPTPVTPVGPVGPGEAASTSSAPAGSTSTASIGDGSQLLPPPPSGLNWPVISILTVGFLGAIAASFLIYSIAHETPKQRVVEIDTSGRYWLDRMIENDIPIVEETVNYPHNTQLFGKPAPIQRIDARHNAIPRPRFSAPGGKSGVLQATPAMPDEPSPDLSGSDAGRIVRIHAGRPSQRQSALAEPTPESVSPVTAPRVEPFASPAGSVSPTEVETVVFGDAGQKADSNKVCETPSRAGRKFHIDTGHPTADLITDNSADKSADQSAVTDARTRSRTTSGRRPVAVQPSPVVVQGANLLDRILTTVDQDQTAARQHSNEGRSDERPSDRRGNS